jgi:hypothetical protein
VGEELSLWQRYLPVRTELENVPFSFHDNMPHRVIEQLEKAQKAPHLFERIDIWSRTGDPMAVGVAVGEPTRYFSIARWGGCETHARAGKKKIAGGRRGRMDVQVDSSGIDLDLFSCDIGSDWAWRPRVRARFGVSPPAGRSWTIED